MASCRLLLITIKGDIFMLSSKIELMKNANEIKECLGASAFKKRVLTSGNLKSEIILK